MVLVQSLRLLKDQPKSGRFEKFISPTRDDAKENSYTKMFNCIS